MTNAKIAGEDVDAIVTALQLAQTSKPDTNGMCRLDLRAPLEVLAPLWRALMRIEAQLLLADADEFPRTEASCRSGGERRVDALMQITQRIRILDSAV